MATDVAFPDKDVLVNHIYNKLDNPTLLKVQKSLYLLWAYYSATYGSLTRHENEDSDMMEYPAELFKPDFEAWRYGPVDRQIYAEQKQEKFSDKGEPFHPTNEVEKDIFLFVDDLLEDIDGINDFGLVERTHQDHAWKDVYEEGKTGIKMNAAQIKAEYTFRFDEESKI